jgi:tRNA threonylcarbamoyladenosine biosynthesis protein TsaE
MALTFESRNPDGSVTVQLPREADTLDLGARLAAALRPGLLVYLSGELGAGKTTLVRGCLRALGYRGRVKSPTFTLVEVYRLSSLYLHHFDFYRFSDPREWIDAGFRDVFGGDNVCLVEWPEKAGDELPPADLAIRLEHAGNGRTARIAAHTEAGAECLDRLST